MILHPQSSEAPKKKANSNHKNRARHLDFTSMQSMTDPRSNGERPLTATRQPWNEDTVTDKHIRETFPDINRRSRPKTVSAGSGREITQQRPSVTQIKSSRQKSELVVSCFSLVYLEMLLFTSSEYLSQSNIVII